MRFVTFVSVIGDILLGAASLLVAVTPQPVVRPEVPDGVACSLRSSLELRNILAQKVFWHGHVKSERA
jgi:hypothetical protein